MEYDTVKASRRPHRRCCLSRGLVLPWPCLPCRVIQHAFPTSPPFHIAHDAGWMDMDCAHRHGEHGMMLQPRGYIKVGSHSGCASYSFIHLGPFGAAPAPMPTWRRKLRTRAHISSAGAFSANMVATKAF